MPDVGIKQHMQIESAAAKAASKDELTRKSGMDDAVRILKRIKRKYPDLGEAIRLPGGKGRGGLQETPSRV